MQAKITTQILSTEEILWQKLLKLESLQFISKPILYFKPYEDNRLTGNWETGKKYQLSLYLFKHIPLGKHQIEIVGIDRNNNKIASRESGKIAKVWNHTIIFKRTGKRKVQYSDIITIQAGLLTPLVWTFAHFFYRHRQARWKKLLANKSV